ncbi:MAG: molybdopterin cofactor-binding domain-containing protein [Rhodomicrobium sp.]
MNEDGFHFPKIRNVSRRAFLLGAAGSLVVAAGLGYAGLRRRSKFGGESTPHGLRDDPKVFLAISEDGTVTLICHRSEMGQGIRTGLALIAADELEADWSLVKVTQAPADEEKFGNQDTDGSRSMRHHFLAMRRAGAAARMMLEEAAAAQWSVPVSAVKASNHEVVHLKSGQKLGFGALAKAALALPVPADIKLKHTDNFRYIGKEETEIVDGFDIATGRAVYGIDTRVEDMLYAVAVRPPVYGGRVKSYDASEAMKVPGVVKVAEIDPVSPPSEYMPVGGVGIIASSTWAAIKGREALKIEWDAGPNATYSSENFRAQLEAAAEKPGKIVRENGDVDAAMAGAVRRQHANYYIPHLAQAPMEPPAAVVLIKDGKCEAWASVQSPQAARDRLAKRLGMSPENVTVHVTLLGGGFGRKSIPDFAVEAGILSQAVGGRPVKLTWTRDDDLQHSYYHTVSAERLEAGLDAAGMPVAWLHRSVAPSLGSTFSTGANHEISVELGMGFVNTPFALPNARFENPEAEAHTRIGWFRSVSNIPHCFAVQSFVAELAAAAGRDQKDYLLELIGPARRINPRSLGDNWNYGEDPSIYAIDTGRLRNVIETAASAIGWGRAMPNGHGLGIAAHYSFLTYVAVAVEIAVGEGGALAMPKVDIAIDCGPRVNPERIRAQMEGAFIMGQSLAILSEITFKDGAVQQTNFDTYRLARMNLAPAEIKVHFVGGEDWNEPLGGVGEPGLPPVAPAICNAIFAATGERIRSLPIGDQLRA